MTTAILTLSWDEGAGWTDGQLDIACVMTPWFFFLGHLVIFAALFTRLYRVDRVLQFRRHAVNIHNVMGPLLGLLAPAETLGQCTSDRTFTYFGSSMALMVIAEGLALFFAWKTSDVPYDFRETGTVAYAICTHIQAWIVGVPILAVLGNSSADATCLGRTLLIWLFAISSTILVVGSKVSAAIRLRRNPHLQKMKPRVMVSGVFARPCVADDTAPQVSTVSNIATRGHDSLNSRDSSERPKTISEVDTFPKTEHDASSSQFGVAAAIPRICSNDTEMESNKLKNNED